MFDIISVGGATVDLFVNTSSELITISNGSLKEDLLAYPVGSKILIKSIERRFGGGGFNTAVSLSRLNLKTGFLCCLGRDNNSSLILKRIKSEKINFLGYRTDKPSGFSIVLDSIDEDRTILSFRGSNDFFDFKRVNKNKLKTKWFYISSFTEHGLNSINELVDFAVKHNIKLAFNPSTYLAKLGFRKLKKIITNLNVLVLNKEEAGYITEEPNVEEMLLKLKKYVKDVVVITDGKNGAFCYDGSDFYRANILKVKVLETTGAGDAFSSTFVYSTIKGYNITKRLQLAMINSSSVVKHMGAQEILLKERDLLNASKRRRVKIKKSKRFID